MQEVTEELPAQYRVLGRRAFGTDDLAEIFDHLLNDQDLRYTTARRSSPTPAAASTRPPPPWATGSASCPQAPCVLTPIPDYLAADAPAAYYTPPAPDGSRPGEYHVNLHEPTERGPGRDGIDRLPRSDPRPPPPARHRQRADRPARVPPPLVGPHRLRRGLGALHRAAGRGDEPLPDRHRPPRHVGQRLVAGLPPGGRHRPARHGLDPPAGHRLHGGARAGAARTRSSPRSTATSACPARPSPTRSASARSCACEPRPRLASGADFSLPGFHDVVLSAATVSLAVLAERVEAWTGA